jgi:hypothetical protein
MMELTTTVRGESIRLTGDLKIAGVAERLRSMGDARTPKTCHPCELVWSELV